MSKDFPVTGLAELDRFLSALPANMQKGAYRAALTAAARPIRDEARALAPRKTGALAKSIKSGSPRQNQDGSFSITVRTEGKDGYLGVFFEYGVAPHYIASTGKGEGRVAVRKAVNSGEKIGGVLKIGDDFVTGAVLHPGHGPRPFMRPALEARSGEAVKAFADRIRSYIEGKTGFAAPVAEAA